MLRKYRDLDSERVNVDYSKQAFSSMRYVSLQLGIVSFTRPKEDHVYKARVPCANDVQGETSHIAIIYELRMDSTGYQHD